MQRLPTVQCVALSHYRSGERYRCLGVAVNDSPHRRELWGVWGVSLSMNGNGVQEVTWRRDWAEWILERRYFCYFCLSCFFFVICFRRIAQATPRLLPLRCLLCSVLIVQLFGSHFRPHSLCLPTYEEPFSWQYISSTDIRTEMKHRLEGMSFMPA